MISLRGNLSLAFGNFVCLRGFAQIDELAYCSDIDKSYQRVPSVTHVDSIVRFLKSGKYKFFPEVILGVSLESLLMHSDSSPISDAVEDLYGRLRMAADPDRVTNIKELGIGTKGFKYKFDTGAIISVYEKRFNAQRKRVYDDMVNSGPLITSYYTAGIHGLDLYGAKRPLFRIDGNHRLEAVKKLSPEEKRLVIPYCLIFFETDDSCAENGALVFHNVNYHAEKIPDSKNDELILLKTRSNGEYLIPDDALKSDPSLGKGQYYYARQVIIRLKAIYGDDLAKLRFLVPEDKQTRIELCCSFLVVVLKRILYDRNVVEVDSFCEHLTAVTDELHDSVLAAKAQIRLAIVGALVYERLVKSEYDYRALRDYIDKHRMFVNENLTLEFVLTTFESNLVRRKRRIFVSMPFRKYACDYHFETIECVIKDINRQCEKQLGDEILNLVKVDDRAVGGTFEINQRIADEISDCGCLIADLTYNSSNVFYEVGLLMGRIYALKGRPENFDMILLCDENESLVKEIKFSLRSLQIVCFKTPKELRDRLKNALLTYYNLIEEN